MKGGVEGGISQPRECRAETGGSAEQEFLVVVFSTQEPHCEREMDTGANPGRVRKGRDARFLGRRRCQARTRAEGRLLSSAPSDCVEGNFYVREERANKARDLRGAGEAVL